MRFSLIPESLRDSGSAARLPVCELGAAPRWAGASRLPPRPAQSAGAAHRRGAERTARSSAGEPGGSAGVEAQAPSRRARRSRPSRCGPQGTGSGSVPGEIADAAAGERAEAGGPGRHWAEALRFLGLSWPVGSGMPSGTRRRWVDEAHPPGRTPGRASLTLPRRPKLLFTTKSGRGSQRRWAEIFLSLSGDPFWKILLCSAWACVQLQQMRVPVPGSSSSSSSVSWFRYLIVIVE